MCVCFIYLFIFFKDESEYLKSVCSAAGEGTDRNPDKYVLRLHCSLSRVCVLSRASARAYVHGLCVLPGQCELSSVA